MLRLIAIALLMAFVATPPLWAQKTETKKRKSPVLAFLLEAHPAIPLLGHWYAGDVKKGILPTLTNLGGIIVYIESGPHTRREDIGALMSISGWVWRMVSAYIVANRTNEQNRRLDQAHLLSLGRNKVALSVNPVVLRDGSGVRLTFDF